MQHATGPRGATPVTTITESATGMAPEGSNIRTTIGHPTNTSVTAPLTQSVIRDEASALNKDIEEEKAELGMELEDIELEKQEIQLKRRERAVQKRLRELKRSSGV